jgi:hypothetical protein|uniref:Uncharacterized protein n=1 Tax=viral metagenome TaxID=1070528 RepID=A0A6C0IUW5_9ZZZZ
MSKRDFDIFLGDENKNDDEKKVVKHAVDHVLLERIIWFERLTSYIQNGKKNLYNRACNQMDDRKMMLLRYEKTLSDRELEFVRQWHLQLEDTWYSVCKNLATTLVNDRSSNQIAYNLLNARGSIFEGLEHYKVINDPVVQNTFIAMDNELLSDIDEYLRKVCPLCNNKLKEKYHGVPEFLKVTREFFPNIVHTLRRFSENVLKQSRTFASSSGESQWSRYRRDIVLLSAKTNSALANVSEGWGRIGTTAISQFTNIAAAELYKGSISIYILRSLPEFSKLYDDFVALITELDVFQYFALKQQDEGLPRNFVTL